MTEQPQMTLVIGNSLDHRRDWLHPKWYTSPGTYVSMVGPWPSVMEWRPDPDPERICVRCGADKNEGTVFRDPEGCHCEPCHDLMHPFVPSPPVSPLRRLLRRVRCRLSRRLDDLYKAWCWRFGEHIMQEEPPYPD